ncbi:MAG: membrane protein insertase YidC [Balneolaceae bacterium]|nr:MAG: membrane protein insertase YidC [Balneolaceae bacterium]
MDRNTVIGLVLIFVLTLSWAMYTMPSQEEMQRRQAERDSIAAAQAELQDSPDALQPDTRDATIQQLPERDVDIAEGEITTPTRALGLFADASEGDTLITVIRTPLYEIELSTLGAGPVRFTLFEHNTWDQRPVQMIMDTLRSAYSLGFLSQQNYNIETNELIFEALTESTLIELDNSERTQVSYRLRVDNDSEIIFHYTFYANQYAFDLDILFVDMERHISGTNVEFGWKSALNLTERDFAQDALGTEANVYLGGGREKFQLGEQGSGEQRFNGNIDWVMTKTRFFGQFIKPVTHSNAAILQGEIVGEIGLPETVHRYQVYVQSNFVQHPTLSYELYAGPLQYYDLRDFDSTAYDVVEIGYALIRWFADPLVRYMVIPFFTFGSMFIGNYGVLIILFGVIVKLLLFPLTQKSFKSMAAMKELQPQMKEIQEKFKDDPQKQQKETIALYRKAKVNPLGGCLPMLLQFPILITLFFFFQNSMLIRQQPFLWADDLSAPDYILSLPFSIPLLGDQIAGFVLLMSAAMFFQSKISGGMSTGSTPAGAPNMKVFMYMIPFVLLFVFNNFASGLSLYYLVYNVLSIGQQAFINKQMAGKKDETPEIDSNNKKRPSGSTKKRRKK